MRSHTWNQTIGEKLRKLRVRRNYSQAFVAECLGLSRNAYLEWENGKIDFTISRFDKICTCYGINISELLIDLELDANFQKLL